MSTFSPLGAHARQATGDGLAVEPQTPSRTLLTASNVSKRFVTSRHDTTALEDISLEMKSGEFVCVVGPSGCGKSTLLNLIAGLDFPTSGHLVFDGKPIKGSGADRVVVFQEAALYPWLNVRANVEFGLKIKGTPKNERRDIVDRYLELVNLTRFEKAFSWLEPLLWNRECC
jgi:sulfonate transport system ATP-binding protein